MFKSPTRIAAQSSDNWSGVQIDSKQKLFRLHQFLFLSGGKNYNIEIQESISGSCTGHADNTADPHDAIQPCSGRSVSECLKKLVDEISKRTP